MSLDRVSEAFIDHMVVDDAGDAVLPRPDLGIVLESLGIASELSGSLGATMDPQNSGFIGFEDFVNMIVRVLDMRSSVYDEDNDSDGGFEPVDEANHPPAAPSPVNPAALRIFSLFARGDSSISLKGLQDVRQTLGLDTSDEDLKRMLKLAASAPAGNDESGQSQKNLRKNEEISVDQTSFDALWTRLNYVLGPEIGTEVVDLPSSKPNKSQNS